MSDKDYYVILNPKGEEECRGDSNYKAWSEFYALVNTFADNIHEFKAHCVKRGWKCQKRRAEEGCAAAEDEV